jgi:hypothetical protein
VTIAANDRDLANVAPRMSRMLRSSIVADVVAEQRLDEYFLAVSGTYTG